ASFTTVVVARAGRPAERTVRVATTSILGRRRAGRVVRQETRCDGTNAAKLARLRSRGRQFARTQVPMSMHPPFFSVLHPNPPPIWFVTNGAITVGPVLTGLLMRGVDEGRVPEYCRVSADQTRWRKLESVREIAARMRPANAAETAVAL